MPRVSNKENKNIYFSRREELKLTRDQASELLESIPPERIEKIENEITGEKIYLLILNYNDVLLNLAINEMDLEGEPKPGRRFKGNIWLQGRIVLPSKLY